MGSIINSYFGSAGTLTLSPSGVSRFGGTIAGGAGTIELVMNGPGTQILSGANTYSGGTTINGGVLQFANTEAMPPSGMVIVGSGATLAVNAGGPNQFTKGTSGNGAIGGLLAGLGGQPGSTVSWNSGANLGIDTTNASGGTLTYGGDIANPGGNTLGLVKLGAEYAGALRHKHLHGWNDRAQRHVGAHEQRGPCRRDELDRRRRPGSLRFLVGRRLPSSLVSSLTNGPSRSRAGNPGAVGGGVGYGIWRLAAAERD